MIGDYKDQLEINTLQDSRVTVSSSSLTPRLVLAILPYFSILSRYTPSLSTEDILRRAAQTCAWVAQVMSHPLISMIWSPGCSLPSLATRPSGKTSWTTTQRRGVSEPPTMVTPRLALVLGISTWDTSPSRMGSLVI